MPLLSLQDHQVLQALRACSKDSSVSVHSLEPTVSRAEYIKALHQVELLQRQVQDLETMNLELKTTVRIMMGIRQEAAAGLHKVSDSNPDFDHTPRDVLDYVSSRFTTVEGLRVPLDDLPSPAYDIAKHGRFRFWSADQWTPFSGNGAQSHEARKDGVPIFLEDENGDVFTPYRYTELCKLVKRLFQTLAQHSLAPATWGTRTVHAYRYMQHEVYKSFPVLAQCQGHFRLHILLTQMYPNFTRYYLNAAIKKEHNEDDRYGSSEPPDASSAFPKKTSVKPAAMAQVVPSHASKWPKHAGRRNPSVDSECAIVCARRKCRQVTVVADREDPSTGFFQLVQRLVLYGRPQ
ncbi:hypothetical protein OH77DRAFT_1328318 [Trametes cingulata]|nr:hypothetical protein OH77DRAFT_1328318 [Trametes cingulata]